MENAKKFFEEVAKTEEAKALFDAMDKPEKDEDIVAAYIEIAKKLGVELTAEEVKEYLAADKVNGEELDDEELSQLTGGAKDHERCLRTFRQRQNCWAADACDNAFLRYSGYYCNKVLKDGSMMNPSANSSAVTDALTGVVGSAADVAQEFK